MTTITERAMITTLSISTWTARKHDKRVDQTVDTHYQAHGAGRFSKVLIAEEAIKAVQKAANCGRTFHYEQTLPWSDTGQRLLPLANFQAYSEQMRALHAAFDAAVQVFTSNYPSLVAEARGRLNGLFREDDYPADIASKFAWSVDILPVPTGSDFRVNLQADELTAIQQQIETRTQGALRVAHADLYRRLAEAVGHMADKLDSKDGIFRDSLVENLQELCLLLPKLDIVGDPNLEALRQRVESKLCAYSAEALRNYGHIRQAVATDASDILSALEGFYHAS